PRLRITDRVGRLFLLDRLRRSFVPSPPRGWSCTPSRTATSVFLTQTRLPLSLPQSPGFTSAPPSRLRRADREGDRDGFRHWQDPPEVMVPDCSGVGPQSDRSRRRLRSRPRVLTMQRVFLLRAHVRNPTYTSS